MANYEGSVSVSGVEALASDRLHITVTPSGATEKSAVTMVPGSPGYEVSVDGANLRFRFTARAGSTDIAYWYDANGDGTREDDEPSGTAPTSVVGKETGLCRGAEPAKVPHTWLRVARPGGTDEPVADPPRATPLKPCRVGVFVTGQREPHGGEAVREHHEVSVYTNDWQEDGSPAPEAVAPAPIRKAEALARTGAKDKDGVVSIPNDQAPFSLRLRFDPEGRATEIFVDPIADSRDFRYVYEYACDPMPRNSPANIADLVLDEP